MIKFSQKQFDQISKNCVGRDVDDICNIIFNNLEIERTEMLYSFVEEAVYLLFSNDILIKSRIVSLIQKSIVLQVSFDCDVVHEILKSQDPGFVKYVKIDSFFESMEMDQYE